MPSRSLLRSFAPWLILLLLLSQGLRLCIPNAGDPEHHKSVIHLESLFTVAADQHESGQDGNGDTDLTLTALLKLFSPSPLDGPALLIAFLSLVLVHLGTHRFLPDERSLRPPRGSGITPPLRAPPR